MAIYEKENIFLRTQKFLKNPPLIIWGSGATIPFGIPSMGKLNEILSQKISNFDKNNKNLEIELGNEKYKDQMPEIKKIIWEEINKENINIHNKIKIGDLNNFVGIEKMVSKFINAHPEVVNIITTNYDCVLEYIFSYYSYKFTDGFCGREFSQFDLSHFQEKKIINLIKVHGSLNWHEVGNSIRYLNISSDNLTPMIICPGRNKYQEAYKSPYRELIQKSDLVINNAKSFLVVGFGFNDEHITPKIKEKVAKGIPLVLITKKITETCYKELESANKLLLFEEESNNKTKVEIRDGDSVETLFIDGNYWQLSQFMEIFF